RASVVCVPWETPSTLHATAVEVSWMMAPGRGKSISTKGGTVSRNTRTDAESRLPAASKPMRFTRLDPECKVWEVWDTCIAPSTDQETSMNGVRKPFSGGGERMETTGGTKSRKTGTE